MLTDTFQTVALVLFTQGLSRVGLLNSTIIVILGNLLGLQSLQKHVLAVCCIENGIMER